MQEQKSVFSLGRASIYDTILIPFHRYREVSEKAERRRDEMAREKRERIDHVESLKQQQRRIKEETIEAADFNVRATQDIERLEVRYHVLDIVHSLCVYVCMHLCVCELVCIYARRYIYICACMYVCYVMLCYVMLCYGMVWYQCYVMKLNMSKEGVVWMSCKDNGRGFFTCPCMLPILLSS